MNFSVHLLFIEIKENIIPALVEVEHLIQRGDYSWRSQQQPFTAHCFPMRTHCYWFPQQLWSAPGFWNSSSCTGKPASLCTVRAHTCHGDESWRNSWIDSFALLRWWDEGVDLGGRMHWTGNEWNDSVSPFRSKERVSVSIPDHAR